MSDDSRYGPDWSKKSHRARQSTFGLCALCWTRRSKQTHHARYADALGAIRGREVPGWDIFPLCGSTREPGSCHTKVHQGKRWDRKTERNDAATLTELRASYVALWVGLRLVPVMLTMAAMALGLNALKGQPMPVLPRLSETTEASAGMVCHG